MNGNPTQSFYQINNTIGVSTVVYCGYSALEINQRIIDEIQARADASGEIYEEKKPETFPGRAGDLVKFKENSPLFGFIAEIKRVDTGGRLMVELDKMLGSARDVAVSALDVGQIIHRPKDSASRPLEPTGRGIYIPASGGSLP